MSDVEYTRQPVYQHDRQSSGQYDSSYQAPVYTQNVERQPVNGFNYEAHGGEEQVSATPSSLRDYSYYQGDKLGNPEYEPVGTTEVPELPKTHHQDYSHYNDASLQSQSNYNAPSDNYERNENTRTEYHQSQREKQIEYDLQQPTTELPLEVGNFSG